MQNLSSDAFQLRWNSTCSKPVTVKQWTRNERLKVTPFTTTNKMLLMHFAIVFN